LSTILYNAVIQALKEAHEAYLAKRIHKYQESMRVAESGIAAIESLGTEDDCGREMELMGLRAEATLMHTLPWVHQPSELIPQYEIASVEMLMPPSRVISSQAPMIPHCEDVLDFFGGASDHILQELEKATALYSRLTDGGGGGVAEIYRAEMEKQRGASDEAAHWAKLALERMAGDKWIEPIAMALIPAAN